MDLFSEIEDFNTLFCEEKNNEINCENGFEDLQNKYTNLHENYSKEVDNNKKVGKSLAKCLKFYSKLCKKYEVQQKLISNLEQTIQEKCQMIEESQKDIEKMTGLIRVYESERTLFQGPGCDELRNDKELLLDICCRLMRGADRSSNTRSIGKLLLRKFRKDLDDERINVIKKKMIQIEEKLVNVKPDILDFGMNKMEFKFEEKYSKELKKDLEEVIPEESENICLKLGVVEGEEFSQDSKNVLLELKSVEEKDKQLEGGCTLCASELASLPIIEESADVRDVSKSNSPAIPVVTPFVDNTVVEPAGFDLPATKSIFDLSDDCFSSEIDDLSFWRKEVDRILAEMTLPRLLSPIPFNVEDEVPVIPETSQGCEPVGGKKRASEEERVTGKRRKPCGPLDSIMSAMSLQNEVFKSRGCPAQETSFAFTRSPTRGPGGSKSEEDGGSSKENLVVRKSGQQAEEKLIRDGLNEFIETPLATKEDADKNVRQCLKILSSKPEELIAKSIVSIVLENIDEPVEAYERPAPPLTKTQHRLMVLLSVFQNLDNRAENLPPLILSMISKKFFPDNFFWPDDSIEAASRFYAAVCRSKNDTKNLWKFCIRAMSHMRQRSPIAVFAVLQTWPDVLHDSSTLKNNILAVTIVNLFLHMPKTEGLRNLNQKRKLMALKHLLMNFYQFKIEDTIEAFAKRVFESVLREEAGAEKSFVLLANCREAEWAVKNLVPVLKDAVVEWGQERVGDKPAHRIVSVIKQISPTLSKVQNGQGAKVKEMIASLCEVLKSGSKSHELEVQLVEVLLGVKQYEEARKAVSEWIPKKPIDATLRNEIINMSAENILKELKPNRRREGKTSPRTKQKPRKIWKGKKKRKANKRKSGSGNFSGASS